MDQAGVINPRSRELLEQLVRSANDHGKIQLQILTLKSLQGYTIEQAGILITDQWKLGTAKKDNGVLLIVAPDEKKSRIEVGQGLEGEIPDAIAKRILADVARPYFQQDRYADGILAASIEIIKRADPEFQFQNIPAQIPPKRSHDFPIIFILFAMFILFSKIFGGRRRGFGYWGGGWGGGFGGGGGFGSGGGGWSGGGGGFSGGGSSDSW